MTQPTEMVGSFGSLTITACTASARIVILREPEVVVALERHVLVFHLDLLHILMSDPTSPISHEHVAINEPSSKS